MMQKSIYTGEYRAMLRRLRQARKERGFTQSEVARRLQISQSLVSKWEMGEIRMDIIELQQILKVYDKDLYYVLGDDDNS